MNQWVEWLSMGGYFLYVWPAYGLVIATLVLNGYVVKKQKNRVNRLLKQWFNT
jgi:heme exporter protein D